MRKLFRRRAFQKIVLFAALFCLIFGISWAEERKPLSGKKLLEKISSSNKEDRDYALGYITGVFCVSRKTTIPDARTMKKVVKAVKKYLKSHPDRLDQPAVKLLEEAFEKEFPVKKEYKYMYYIFCQSIYPSESSLMIHTSSRRKFEGI
jgi:hypothetical protein